MRLGSLLSDFSIQHLLMPYHHFLLLYLSLMSNILSKMFALVNNCKIDIILRLINLHNFANLCQIINK